MKLLVNSEIIFKQWNYLKYIPTFSRATNFFLLRKKKGTHQLTANLKLRGSFKKFYASPRRDGTIETTFHYFFHIVPLNINTPSPAMFMHCNLLMEKSSILPPVPNHYSTTQIVSKSTTRKVSFEFRELKKKKKKSQTGRILVN